MVDSIELAGVREKALSSIRRRKEKIEEAERFLKNADAETLSFLQAAFQPNGKVHSEPTQTLIALDHDSDVPASIQRYPRTRVARGELHEKVGEAVRQVKSGITVHNVYKLLTKEGFQFHSKDHLVSIGVVLRKLRKRGVLDEVGKASGNKPAVFRLKTMA